MSVATLLVAFVLLFALEIVYFRIADHFDIIDKPNHRSSHSNVTLRGGGIIFAIGLLLYPVYFGNVYSYFLVGLAIIACVSFVDDIRPVSNKLRIVVHLVAVALMFYQLNLFNLPVYWILGAFFLVIGSINAINFMDGINGITGSYALITLSTFLFINSAIAQFTTSNFIIVSIVSVVVFNFFNFRKTAKCFAGDVGSVSIAFIILFLLLQLIIKTEDFKYLLLLLLYGMDTVTTIFFRLIRKENIFDAHRSHFYQHLANERNVSHLIVSSIYSLVQLFLNLLIIFCLSESIALLLTTIFCCSVVFIIIRFSIEGRLRLLGEERFK